MSEAERFVDLENNDELTQFVVKTTKALMTSLTEVGNLTFAMADAMEKQRERIKELQHRIEAIETKN